MAKLVIFIKEINNLHGNNAEFEQKNRVSAMKRDFLKGIRDRREIIPHP